MDKIQKQALQVAKEIVVKFIETGRISPTNFNEHFGAIYRDVLEVVRGAEDTAKDRGEGGTSGP